MTPTPRAASAVALIAVSALLLPLPAVVLLAVALVAATLADAVVAHSAPVVVRELPAIVARGVPAPCTITVGGEITRRARVRQPAPPDVEVRPAERHGGLDAVLLAHRRGRHLLGAVAVRVTGPLGLAAWHHRCSAETTIDVYPDVYAARRLALDVRRGRFGAQGQQPRGPLGLGTQFETVRDYTPDDDIRQVNWRATARVGRPMSNHYRVEQDRDVICVVDTGRLMAAPIGGLTRLDAAIDAAVAVALVADVAGDRCGALAFASTIRRHVTPRRAGGDAVVRALYDLEPEPLDSDYERAFHEVGRKKRSLALVFTDVLEDAAAAPLIEAVPVLARRHAVIVATVTDPDLEAIVSNPPATPFDAYTMAVAVDVLDTRARVVASLRAAGATVVEARPEALGPACVAQYLRAKQRARV